MTLSPEMQQALRAVSNLPSPPRVALKVVELAEQPDPDLEAVGRVLSTDPALTTKILRIANSALYAQRRTSQNLRQALLVLGMHATMTLALSFSLATSLRRALRSGLRFKHYWQRALLSAMSARALGRWLKRHDTEELFLAGLLQDIGMLVIDQAFPDAYRDCEETQSDHVMLVATERDRLGVDHAEIGAWLLTSWNMPALLRLAVGASHDQEAAGLEGDEQIVCRIVALSGQFADIWLNGDDEQRSLEAAQQAARLFDMDREAVSDVLGQVRDQIPVIEALFEVEVLDHAQAEGILGHAREILMVRNLQALQEVRCLRETAQTLEQRTKALEEATRRDKLTGAFNRGYLDERLLSEWKAAKENNWPLSVLFADLDRFKLVNDTHGHQAGDEVLRESARLMGMCTRKEDVLARYGGEEFVILLPGAGREAARIVAERIVARFRHARHRVENGPELKVTVSVGVATRDDQAPFDSVEKLVGAADKAVYAAKVLGRDRVVIHGAEAVWSGPSADTRHDLPIVALP